MNADAIGLLSECLKTNKTLMILNLSMNSNYFIEENKIGSDGAKHIARILNDSESLISLGLSNYIRNIENTNLRTEGIIIIADALKENNILTTLSIGNNKIGETGIVSLMDVLANNSTLKYLSLRIYY